ncbi:MAG: helix-turn-helix domain-containing protein [Myxococcaceae bacterium]|nr:helix-turn-helix domain-containing protein [Myxococcaceae bacterium]
MATPALQELGRRLRTCREEAGFDIAALNERARVSDEALRNFERGEGGIGLAGLTRIASTRWSDLRRTRAGAARWPTAGA